MLWVRVTGATNAPPHKVLKELSPETIVRFGGNYKILNSRSLGNKQILSLEKTSSKGDILAEFEFTELDDGYLYVQKNGTGPFEEMQTVITVEGDNKGTTIIAHSEYTFGGLTRFIVDRLAVQYRKQELANIISQLITEVEIND